MKAPQSKTIETTGKDLLMNIQRVIGITVLLLLLVVGCGELWRSTLYPEDWTPAHADAEGRFLHDFSYAGYKNGDEPIPTVTGPEFSVVSHGADPLGKKDSTGAIQRTIDLAVDSGGGVVFFPAGLYRCDGTLEVSGSGVVLRGAGPASSRLYFTKHSGHDMKAHITFRGKLAQKGSWPLVSDGKNRSHTVSLDSVVGLAVGDEVAVGFEITDAFRSEHGMSKYWKFSAKKWRPFFRREITAIDPATGEVTLDVPLRYPVKVRDSASLRKETGYLSGCGIEELGLSNAVSWDDAWKANQISIVDFRGTKDSWLSKLNSFASPLDKTRERHLQSGGLRIQASKRVTVRDCKMGKAQNRGPGGNGYLFEIRQSSEILVRDCEGYAGRHNFIQNWDFGCVFLDVLSRDGRAYFAKWDPVGKLGPSEYHHALAMANLVDRSDIRDGWSAVNRKKWSSGAGHSATQCVFWNLRGGGKIRSNQYGQGYVIGTESRKMRVITSSLAIGSKGTRPRDHVEGVGKGGTLEPASLYEDQLKRRTSGS